MSRLLNIYNEVYPVISSGVDTPPFIQLPSSRWLLLRTQPDILGRFGQFGGKCVPETLMPALVS